jgi:error-prone DNA polymerase
MDFSLKYLLMNYAELQVTSNFSFLRGGSHPEELVTQAASYGYSAVALADRNTVAGVVRAHTAAKKAGIRFIPACRLDLQDGPGLLAYPTNKSAWEQLCSLLTKGNIRTEKGLCELYKKDVYEYAQGMKFIIIPPDTLNERFDFDDLFKIAVSEYRKAFGPHLYIAATRSYNGDDSKRFYRLSQSGIPMVAANDVHFHEPARRELQDVLTCVREKCTIHTAGFRLHQNAERFLKPIAEMHRLFRQYPDAITNANEIADTCRFSLDDLNYVYPEEITSEGRTPQEELIYLTWKGAHERFPSGIPEKISNTITFELEFIDRKKYAAYFLTVYDLVHFARSKDILCQGRGSAANSVVCYCLGITSVDPSKFNLLFARFMSDARDEPPDIDVDFEHERREEVIQYIYKKYGRDRAGIVATVTQERYKGAIRDVGKAMGLSVDTINRLSGSVWSYSEEKFDKGRIKENGLNPDDRHLAKVLELTDQLIGFPRQLGQHTGGFVITQNKLSHLCPILNARMENRTCIEWNKDDIEALGFMKVDVLALGMLTCIRKGFDLVKQYYGADLTLANIPQDVPGVYDMICRADTIGVFQIESRAQMSMLPRLKPKEFYDLVIEVAIVRPGPIQGDMVHPYLRRREGKEPEIYPSEELKAILSRTKGVPLFQEQAMEIAIVAAGFSHTEADLLRRSMATFKAKGKVAEFRKKLIDGMTAKGYTEDFAARVFKQIEGFGSYGFPESHAVSFALLAYVSSYLKWKYPDVFAVALLNSQPMGFYQPAQIVIDAQKHGVEVRAVDVNFSMWDNTFEEMAGDYRAIRLGFRQVKGISEEDALALINGRAKPYAALHQLADAGVSQAAIEKLTDADAFRSLGLDRRSAWWEVPALQDKPVGIYTGQPSESATEPQLQLSLMSAAEHVIEDYAATGLSLKAHPVSFVREKLGLLGVTPAKDMNGLRDGALIRVAGLVLVRQRPGTASGICFITLEDESGIANLVVFQTLFNKYKKEILQSRLLMVEGKLQVAGEPEDTKVIHVVAQRCFNFNKLMTGLSKDDFPALTMSRADEKSDTPDTRTITANKEGNDVFYKGRNFR